ncbi:hypothetical protein EUGRSUZ_I00786 [Eucalyptus grandis]|uniref:Uncharacterized protein n=2 Tax=Eucalyptus grandis TaxID=71139 RepID=A0ACC3JDY6_EUCGR|nr:hypothetical protein EUGRSUZ_I00786 [Eucalyptus grandis]
MKLDYAHDLRIFHEIPSNSLRPFGNHFFAKSRSDSKDNEPAEKLVKIQIPAALRKQLVDDWEFVTQRDKLVKLPRSPSVDEIFTNYLEYRTKKDGIIACDALVQKGAPTVSRSSLKLPELLARVNIEEDTLTRLQQKLLDFLKFLQKNQSTFFLSAYEASKASEGKGKRKDEGA